MSDLRTALKGDDKNVINKKTDALAQAPRRSRSERMPRRSPPEQRVTQQAALQGGPGASGGSSGSTAGKDDVVDAEFEEVRDKDRKAS